ncbi:pickpocket protein 19-like [Cochliomyia hominivorax]
MDSNNYNPAQPLALRQLNRKFKNKQKNKIVSNKFRESAIQLALDFGRKSTIHGISRICQENSNKYERLFWLLTFCSALLGSIYVCLILSRRFNAGALQTIVDSTNRPVFKIPFPEITICNLNHLNWHRIEEAKRRFLPNENNTEKLRLFELIISLYDQLNFGKFDVFNVLNDKPLDLVENINFTSVYEFMTWRCDELFSNCVWRHYNLSCCDILLRSRGETGLCWHFNTISTGEGRRKMLLDSKYPWRTGGAGPNSGFKVRIWLNDDKHFTQENEKGITVGVMQPGVFYRHPYWVPANSETVVEVEPVIYFYDNDTRGVSSRKRKCVFSDERNSKDFKSIIGFTYMIENCQSQCHNEYLVSYCNCTMDIFFPPDKYKSCNVKDLLCLAKYNDYFRYTHQPGEEEYVRSDYEGMKCKCFRNCYSLNYVTDIRPSFLPAYMRDNKTYVDLDVHFRFATMMVYRTSLVFGWVDLMVAFGGIAGLFLGCSLISAMELVYFALVELPYFVLCEFKGTSKLEKVDNPQNNQRQIAPKGRNWGLYNRIMAAQNF